MLAELEFGKYPSYVNNRDWFSAYAHQVMLLQHPAFLRVVDVCVDERDQWVLIREALPGRWHWLYDTRVLDNRNQLETISSILLSVSEALSYLHQAKFRGVNFSAWHDSARITYLPSGELHFGMVLPTPRDAHLRPEIYKYEGCTAYSAPEARRFYDAPKKFVYHPPTLATDSFSLGRLFFELLIGKGLVGESTGRRLISDAALNSEIQQKLSGESTVPRDMRSDLSAELGGFMNRSLAESPEVRPSLKEWALMMERLGGRLLRPPRLTEQSSQSKEAIESGTLSLFSVLKGEVKKQKVDLLTRIRPDSMGGEYLVQISSVVPNVKETDSLFNQASNKEQFEQPNGDAELHLISHDPPGAGPVYRPYEFDNSGAITDSDEPTNTSERTTQPLPPPPPVGLPDAFIPNQTVSGRATVNTGALPPDFAAKPDTPLYLDENVQFTVYRPKTIVPQKWYSLLAFAHLSEKREDATEDEPDPLDEVRQQAQRILGEQAADYQNLTQDTLQAVPREGTITFVPTMPGIEFNPPSRSFTWEESVHREDFRLRAERSHDGRVLKGRLSVFLDKILLADIPLSIRVDSHQTPTQQRKALEETHARPYRKIFASYSHRDIEVVEQFERFVEALGDRYLRDVKYLRAGEAWSEKLEAMIVEADIFQLFWSSNSMHSPFVRQEWEYALSLQRPNFIRPTYWEEPLPAKPDQKLPPEELMRLHFQRIQGGDYSRRAEWPTEEGMPMAAAPETTRSRPALFPDGDNLIDGEASGEGRYSDTIEFPPPPPASILEDSLAEIGSSGNYSDEYAAPIPASPLPPLSTMATTPPPSAPMAAPPPPPAPMAAPPPPPAAAMPSYSPIGESSRSGAGGRRLDFGDAPASKSKSRFVPILIVLALGLLALIGVILYYLFS